MAIVTCTVSTRPQKIAPVDAPLWYRLTSSFTNLPNFRYYAEWYEGPAHPISLTKYGRLKIPARPATGEGLLSINSLLKPFMSYSVDPSIPIIAANADMCVSYDIAPGIGYDPRLEYSGSSRGAVISPSDYDTVKVPSEFAFGGGTYYYLRLICAAATPVHNLVLGDEIVISKNLKGVNSYMNGSCKVNLIPFTSQFEVNVLYCANDIGTDFTTSPPTYTEAGRITDVIRIQTIDPQVRWAFFGARQYIEQGLDWELLQVKKTPAVFPPSYAPWPIRGGLSYSGLVQMYLSNWNFSYGDGQMSKGRKKIYLNQSETINFLGVHEFSTDTIKVVGYNSTGSTVYTAFYPFTDIVGVTRWYWGLQVGFSSLFGEEYTAGGIKYYDVSIGDSTDPTFAYSIAARYEVVEPDCKYENVRICWLNRFGGYDYFNFSKEKSSLLNISRKEWKKQLDWNFSIGEREQTVYNVDAQETFTANSDWISDQEQQFLEHLWTSPDIYLVEETYWEGETEPVIQLMPIIITDTTYKSRSQLKEQVFNVTINYKLSHKINIQSS